MKYTRQNHTKVLELIAQSNGLESGTFVENLVVSVFYDWTSKHPFKEITVGVLRPAKCWAGSDFLPELVDNAIRTLRLSQPLVPAWSDVWMDMYHISVHSVNEWNALCHALALDLWALMTLHLLPGESGGLHHDVIRAAVRSSELWPSFSGLMKFAAPLCRANCASVVLSEELRRYSGLSWSRTLYTELMLSRVLDYLQHPSANPEWRYWYDQDAVTVAWDLRSIYSRVYGPRSWASMCGVPENLTQQPRSKWAAWTARYPLMADGSHHARTLLKEKTDGVLTRDFSLSSKEEVAHEG